MIPVTCHVDTQQLGMYSVQALAEYCKEGRVSSYYNVDVSFVDRDTVAEYKKKGAFFMKTKWKDLSLTSKLIFGSGIYCRPSSFYEYGILYAD